MWPLQRQIDKQFSQLQKYAVEIVETYVDRKIRYESISPSIFRSIDIRNLEVLDDDGQPLLIINDLRIHYSILKLLSGAPLQSIREISIENSSISFDQEKDQHLYELLMNLVNRSNSVISKNAESGLSDKIELPPIVISGRNLSIEYSSSLLDLSLSKLFFEFGEGESSFPVSVRSDLNVGLHNDLPIKTYQSHIELDGTVASDISWFEGVLNSDKIGTNLFRMNQFTLSAVFRDDQFSIRKIQDKSPIDLEFSYDLVNSVFAGQFSCEDFVLLDQFRPINEFQFLTDWIRTPVTGNGSIVFSPNDGGLSYELVLNSFLNNQYTPGRIDIALDSFGTMEEFSFNYLNLATSFGKLRYTGDLTFNNRKIPFPSGRFELIGIQASDDFVIDGSGYVSDLGNSLELGFDRFRVNQIHFESLTAGLNIMQEHINFSVFAALPQNTMLELPQQISLDGILRYDDSPYLQAGLHLEDLKVDELLTGLFPESYSPNGILKDFRLSAPFFLYTDFDKISISAPAVDVRDTIGHYMSFSLSGNNQFLDLFDLESTVLGYDVAGNCRLQLENENLSYNGSFNIMGIPYSFSGNYLLGESLILQGDYDLSVLAVHQNQQIGISVKVGDFPVPLQDNTVFISLAGTGYYRDPQDWSFSSFDSVLSNLPFFHGSQELAVAIEATPKQVFLSSIRFSGIGKTLEGAGRISLEIPGALSGWVVLADENSEESLNGLFSYSDAIVNADFELKEFNLARTVDLPVRGLLTGRFNVKGDLVDPVIEADAQLVNGEMNNIPLGLDINFLMDDHRIDVRYLRLDYLFGRLQKVRGTYFFKTGEFAVSGDLQTNLQDFALQAKVGIKGSTPPVASKADLVYLGDQNFEAAFDLSKISFRQKEYQAWSIRIERFEDLITAVGGPDDALRATLTTDGSFSMTSSAPLPLRFNTEGTLVDGFADFELSDFYVDFSGIQEFLVFPFFNPYQGIGVGAFTITGSINDPDFYGYLELKNTYADIIAIPENLGPINTVLTIDEKLITSNPIRLETGQNDALAYVEFGIDRWIPSAYLIDLYSLSDEGIHVDTAIASLAFNGYATGNFKIEGNANQAVLSGDLVAQSCQITIGDGQNVDPQFPTWKREGAFFNLIVDLDFTTGSDVHFLYPSEILPIIRAYADTGQSISIDFDSLSNTLDVKGSVDIKSGEMFYFKRNFYLKEGRIDFAETMEKMNPMISARAEMRDVSSVGDPVTITLTLDNNPLKDLQPRFSSSPSLTNEEILSILGGVSFASDSTQSFGVEEAVLYTTDLLGQVSFIRQFEDQVKDLLNLDMFSIRTQLVQNILLDRVFTPDPETVSFGRYLENTTLFIGKYLGENIFLESLFRFRTEDDSNGIFGVNSEMLRLEAEINMEIKTPIVQIDLGLRPDFFNIEKDFLNPSIGFRWGYSY